MGCPLIFFTVFHGLIVSVLINNPTQKRPVGKFLIQQELSDFLPRRKIRPR
jgi:hypothetical protein